MTSIKHIAAGLIALAMVTTSAMAHQTSVAGSFTVMRGHASVPAAGHWDDNPPRMSARRFGDSEALPQDRPGGVCDHGDNPMIC